MAFVFCKPEDQGFSSDRLSRIRVVFREYLDRKSIPGVVSLIARHGKVVFLDAAGYRYVEAGEPASVDTLYRIASMTKPITSVALMTLFEQGHFSLDDPISDRLPEFSEPRVGFGRGADQRVNTMPAKRPITFRHILTHTAGLSGRLLAQSAEFTGDGRVWKNVRTLGDFVSRYAEMPLNSHPGEKWEYSRSTCVAGRLVEVISGTTLDEFFRKRIFDPLGMTDTHFYLPNAKLGRFAAGYSPGKNEQIRLAEPPDKTAANVRAPHTFFMGSAGLVSTLSDYLRFNLMMMNLGELDGIRILNEKTVRLMTSVQVDKLPETMAGPSMGFGLGYAVAKERANIEPFPWSAGTFTWGGAYCTHQFTDPDKKIVGLMMTQVRPYFHLRIFEDFVKLIYDALAIE